MSNTQVALGRKSKKREATKPIRVRLTTIKKLQKILDSANRKEFGRKIRADAVIDTAVSLITEAEIDALRNASMTNTDRMESAYRAYVARDGYISKDDFYGLLLEGGNTALQIDGASGTPIGACQQDQR